MRSPRFQKEFFDQRDQDSVRADLALFYGKRAEGWLRHYTSRRRQVLEGRVYMPGWSWDVFFGWFTWFWYRKLWAHGLLALLIPVAAGAIAGDWAALVVYLLICMVAKNAYLRVALRTIARADDLGLSTEARQRYLTREGGVSWAGGVAATVLLLGLFAVSIAWQFDEIILQLDALGLFDASGQ